LAGQRAKDAEIASAHSSAERERELRLAAEAQAQHAQQQAVQAQAQAEAASQAQAAAQAEASAERMQLDQARQVPPPLPASAPAIDYSTIKPPPSIQPDGRLQRDLRVSLAQRLNACFPSRDTPRGLIATVSSFDFREAALDAHALANISQIAALVSAHPGLIVEVEGHSDSASPEAERLAASRAEAVRSGLVRAGIPLSMISVRDLGNSRPIGPNNTAQAREANRRTEIVISGPPIGNVAAWDRSYSLLPRN
jgi:outer membrane protein OmpA-like peptidoglycan-associated protein